MPLHQGVGICCRCFPPSRLLTKRDETSWLHLPQKLLSFSAVLQVRKHKAPTQQNLQMRYFQAIRVVRESIHLVSTSSPGVLILHVDLANITGSGGWSAALAQAQAFLAQLNLTEKAYVVTGVRGPCVGSIAPIPRLGFGGLCLQDGPAAIRVADYSSVFPAGITTAASWDKSMIFQRGVAMGQEFRDKGANIILA